MPAYPAVQHPWLLGIWHPSRQPSRGAAHTQEGHGGRPHGWQSGLCGPQGAGNKRGPAPRLRGSRRTDSRRAPSGAMCPSVAKEAPEDQGTSCNSPGFRGNHVSGSVYHAPQCAHLCNGASDHPVVLCVKVPPEQRPSLTSVSRERADQGQVGGGKSETGRAARPGKGSHAPRATGGSRRQCKPPFYCSRLFTAEPPAQRAKGPASGEGGWSLSLQTP